MPATEDAERVGTHAFAEDLAQQRNLIRGRMPAYHRVLQEVERMVAGADADATFRERLARAWRVRAFPAFYDRPLLLLASLRADALADGPSHPLYRAMGAGSAEPSDVTREALLDATAPSRLGFWTTMSTRRVQTNETLRAVAWLLPARLAGCDGGARPLVLADVGASAGLNLVADVLPAPWTDGQGAPIAVATRVRVLARLGLDARPLDVRRDEDVTWLRACLWPTEADRLARFELALGAMRDALARGGAAVPSVERVDAGAAARRITELAAAAPPEALVLVYQTIVSGYMSEAGRGAYEHAMRAFVVAQPPGRAVWIELEMTGASTARLPVELRAHVRGAGGALETIALARTSYHPTTLDLDARGLDRVAARLRA